MAASTTSNDLIRAAMDLYSEALTRTLSGSRHWRRGVDFLHHVVQAMRSIAWTWHEHEDRRGRAGFVAAPPVEGGHPEGEEPPKDLMGPVSPEPDVEMMLVTSREVNRVLRKFWDDRPAMMVITCWERGETMKEKARSTGIATQDLRWAARRIRRFAQKIGQDGGQQEDPQQGAGRQGDRHDRGDTHGR